MSEKSHFFPEQNAVLNSTEIYNFLTIFGINYLPVLNCTKLFFKNLGREPRARSLFGTKGQLPGANVEIARRLGTRFLISL